MKIFRIHYEDQRTQSFEGYRRWHWTLICVANEVIGFAPAHWDVHMFECNLLNGFDSL